MRMMGGLYGWKGGWIKDRWMQIVMGNGCQKDEKKHVSSDGIYLYQDLKEDKKHMD